jgi:outer membrane murein-binding lipoprotein Lpp
MFGISLYKILAVVIGVMLLVGYFKYTQEKMAELNQAVAQKEFALQTATATIEQQQADMKAQAAIAQKAFEDYNEARKQVDDLRDKFVKDGKTLATRAGENPQLLEDKINRATKRVFDCIEDVVNKGKGNGC